MDYEQEKEKIRKEIVELNNALLNLEKQIENIKDRIAYLRGQYDLIEKIKREEVQ